MKAPFLILCLVALSFQACYYDKFNELHPNNPDPCDTTLAATFDQSIVLIMKSNCVSCHSGSNPSGGILLETYQQVADYSTNPKFLKSIRHESGASAMPPNSKIRDCEINKIDVWIQNGVPEK